MNILFGIDLSEESRVAASWACALANRLEDSGEDCDVTGVHVLGREYLQMAGVESVLEDDGIRFRVEREVTRWVEEGLEEACDFDLRLREDERPDDELRALVEETGAELLVLGPAAKGFTRVSLGSTAEKLAHRPPCPIVVVHPEHIPAEDETWVMAVDFSESNDLTLSLAARLAGYFGATLRLLHVVPVPRPVAMGDGFVAYPGTELRHVGEAKTQADERMKDFVGRHSDLLETIQYETDVTTGYPVVTLDDYVEDNDIDVIFMGTVGRSDVGDFLMGSVASGIVKKMPCSIVLTPPPNSPGE